MIRRTAAVAALGVFALAAGTAGAATKKHTITAEGGGSVKVNEYLQDTQKFAPGDITVASGATVKFVNKSKDGAPHSLSLLAKSALPKTIKQVMECPACGPLIAAHEADPQTGEVKKPLVEVGGEGFDTMGTRSQPGDSIYVGPKATVTFRVSAKKGSKLGYFCAIHPWMQGTITVK